MPALYMEVVRIDRQSREQVPEFRESLCAKCPTLCRDKRSKNAAKLELLALLESLETDWSY